MHANAMKKNDKRNNGIGLLTKIWYYAEAWLNLAWLNLRINLMSL